MTDSLERYAFRSYKQLFIHLSIAIALAIILGNCLYGRILTDTGSFVSITSAMTAASGALLSITLIVFFFYSRSLTDSRDKFNEKLAQLHEKLRSQMEVSARFHPDISRELSEFYQISTLYMPGQPVDTDKLDKIRTRFLGWATDQTKKRRRKLDAGDPSEYDSFEVHLRDAVSLGAKVNHTLLLIQYLSPAIQKQKKWQRVDLNHRPRAYEGQSRLVILLD
ncbi:hypothetical protein ACFLWM_02085 [Chloroflexota bacterium]